MANNKSEFNIVDPNKEGNGLQPLEDLNIDVQLTVKTRGRKNQGPRTIKFIEGTIKNSDGTKSLSTNFTEIGTNFGDNNDLETLGIKSIDIDFNASYTPMVKMTFIDLRGDSIMTKGDESRYNFFFQLPYPVFELKIKGYYGKTVTYCLNMTKYGSKFNSDSGHFEINCDFIGYTYAFLSDMLMGYMKAITNTDIGRDKFKELIEQFNKTLPSGSDAVPVPTLNEFIINASKLNTDLEKLKNNDDYISLSKTISSLTELNDIKNYIRSNVFDTVGRVSGLEKFAENINTNDKFKFLTFTISDVNSFKYLNDDFKKNEATFNKLNTKVKEYNKKVGSKYVISESKANRSSGVLGRGTESFHLNLIGNEAGFSVTNGKIDGVGDVERETILNSIIRNKSIVNLYFYECTGLIDEINLREAELKKLKKSLENSVSSSTNSLVTKRFGDFKPTLRNILLMLTTHAEVLINTINEVADNINIDSRSTAVKGAATEGLLTDTYSNGSVIYPFPNYAKDGVTLSWIGELDSGMEEVRYVEDLLNAMIRQQKTEELLIEGVGSISSYFPVNAYDDYKDKLNPYVALNDSAEVKDSLLSVILRASTFFLTGLNPKPRNNNTSPIPNHNKQEIELVARVEANTLFNSLIFDDKNQNKVFEYLETLGNNAESFYTNVKDLITTPNLISGNDLGTTFNNSIFEYKSNEKIFVYQFLTDLENSRQIIPFTDDLRSREIAKADYTGNDTNFVNLLSKNSTNGFDIVNPNSDTYTYPNLPNKPNKDEEIVSNRANLTITEDTYYGEYLGEDSLKLNFGNSDGTPNEITVYGGNEDSFRFRTISISKFEDISTENNNYINFYYNIKPNNVFNQSIDLNLAPLTLVSNPNIPIVYEPHITGLSVQSRKSLFDKFFVESISDISAIGSLAVGNAYNISYDKNPIDENNKDTFSFYSGYDEKNFARKIALYNLGGEDNQYDFDSIYLSNVYWSSAANSGVIPKPITLFGSEFYNKQTNDKAKSLLYLNSLPYRVGEDLDILIEKLLNRQSGVVQVPKMLMVLIGGMLWRKQQTTDPILYYKDSSGVPTTDTNGDEMASIILDSNGNPLKLSYPTLDEFVIAEQFNVEVNKTETSQYLYHLSFINQRDFNNGKLKYVKLPKSITTMNLTLQQKFIDAYEEWYNDVNEGWTVTQKHLEVKLNNPSASWEDNVTGFTTNANNFLINDNYKIKNYITSDEDKTYNTGNTNALTILKVNSDGVTEVSGFIMNSLVKVRNIINSTPQVWNKEKDSEEYFDAFIKESQMKTYLENFYTELISLRTEKIKTDEQQSEDSNNVNSSELENLKLNVYRNIKAIHDKWLGDGNTPTKSACGITSNLFSTFRIIDKHYKDIGDKVIINPKAFVNNITSNSNVSLASFLSKFLASMNFDFIALPNFVDLSDADNIKQMFEPLNYSSNAKSIGPTFICMYVGDSSKHLNLNRKENHKSDGSNVNTDKNFKGNDKALPSAAFLVKYGQQNQSIFKDLELNQQEFTETDEGLIATDALSNPNSIKNGTFINQSLFNIYSTRSYNCGVTCMGNAMIQPMTYFQLENVPMFRGAYLIKNVSHSIKANTMETKFTGSRITVHNVPLLDENTVYLNMLGSINTLSDGSSSLTSNLERSNNSVTFGNNEPKEIVDGVQSIASINQSKPELDNNSQNGVIYV